MKAAELRGMTGEQLDLTLKEEIKNLFHMRVQSATERLETPSQIRKAKRNVARIKTVERERQLAAEIQAAKEKKQLKPAAVPEKKEIKPAAPAAAVKKEIKPAVAGKKESKSAAKK
jgi:large subunit ribosomal protein L29